MDKQINGIIHKEANKMTDGQPPNIIGPIGSLVGLGIMAYGAKTLIDVVKEKTQEDKGRKRAAQYRERQAYTPRIESDDRIQRSLNKMLGR